jgi:lipoic acid synthetase
MSVKKIQPKPEWIKVRLPGGATFNRISGILRERKLHTVCEEARCPNIAECWSSGTATLMLMGDVCTRGCRFCAVTSGLPKLPPDPLEPSRSAETVRLMNLEYVVLTSVNRDELSDGGASHFAKTIQTIHDECPEVLVETLTPDFQGSYESLKTLLNAKPDVFAHNLETVRRLTPTVRDQRATYDQSLLVLENAKRINPTQLTKTSMMLGLGETPEELEQAFKDLREVDVDFLTLGQYLQPTSKHLKVVEFVSPEKFDEFEKLALTCGFRYVASGPLVRSSYRAGEFFISSMIQKQKNEAKIFPLEIMNTMQSNGIAKS